MPIQLTNRNNAINRRQFSKRVLIGAAATTMAASNLASVRAVHADTKTGTLRIAFIGVGGRGFGNLSTVAQDANVKVAALCDVDLRNLQNAAKLHPQARQLRDFRQLYDFENEFDAVVVSTTEHTHAFATMPALRLGKHVYCEKPLTHNVAEARAITEAAAKAGVVTQMGTQIHAGSNYHRVVELIQSGAIGAVRKAHVWVDRAWGRQSKEEAEKYGDIVFVTERPSESVPPPEFLDWDLWLGPAIERAYHPVYFPGPKWYRWWDFGNGTMSDLGSHWNDLPYWALQLTAPTSVEAFGEPPHAEIAPASMHIEYEFPARDSLPACSLTWYQGTHKPKIWHHGGIPKWASGVLFEGDKGMLISDYGQHLLLPEQQFVDFKRPEPFIPASPGQHEQWLASCRSGEPTASPFSYAGPLTETNHLGNVAHRAGSRIEWDVNKMEITNLPEANRFLSRPAKDGWTLS